MAQKPNFLKKLISAGLVTASTATIVASFAGSAMGAAIQQNRTTNNGVATTVDGVGFDQTAGLVNVAVAPNAVITANANNGINLNTPAGSFNGLFLNNANNLAVTVSEDTTLGFINNANNANHFNLTLGADKTLTITGQGITNVQAAATHNAQNIVAQFNGGAAIANNDLSGLGTIDFGAAASTLVFDLANPTTQKAPLILADNALIVNGANGTLNVTNGFIQVSDKSFATVKAINIGDGQGFMFNTNATNANTLNLQAGTTINFNGTDGTGRLVLLSKNGAATDFNVTGSLGGNLKGIIELNTVATNGQLIANAGPANAVIGTNNGAGRAAGFVVSVDNGKAATINGQVYAKDMVIQSANANGPVNFRHIVDVGIDGTTAFKTAASKVAITQNSNFGTTDFGNLAAQITVPDTMTLTGNFTGDANNPGNTAGVITFDANGTLASASADANVAVTNNITAIEASGVGVVQLSGTHTAELRLGNAGSVFKLADGTVINGKVNQTPLVGGVLAAGAITLDGSATITGDIGNGGGGAALQGITLANDATKTLTLGGANIIGANGGTINFQANGGTIKLTSTQNNIVVDCDLAIATDQTGVVDASSLTNAQTLTISGTIGTIGANNKTLEQFNIGSSKTVLNGGNVAINELVIGNNGSVQFAHNSYLITRTTNAAGQGKIIFNPVVNNNTTLAAGTNLGSAANPLAEINFGSKGVHADTVLNVGEGVNLYATNITTTDANVGSFVFNAGGKNIVSGTVGGQQGNKFNTVALDNGTTVKFLGNATFNGNTTIAANSTLQISGNYTADVIASADGTGIVEFVNTGPINVTLNKQAVPVNALKQITVSGPGNVVVNEIGNAGNYHGAMTDTIAFENSSLGAVLFLPSGIPFNDAGNIIPLTIKSTVGNETAKGFNVPSVIVSGVDSVIADGQVIGDQNNIVGLGLGSDNGIIVNATTLYAGIGTINNNQGTVTLSGGIPNTPGTVYGLGTGIRASQFKQVTFTTDYNNLGNIIATNTTINDGVTVTTGGIAGTDFDGKITLGSVNGNANVIFADGIFSNSTSMIVTTKANNGTVTYLGNAFVGNIGDSDTPVASVRFTGSNNGAGLQGNIYSQVIEFGTYNLGIVNSNVILGGSTTAINGKIDLLTNTLTFAGGTSTWGNNTSIETTLTLANGNIGHIVIAEGAQVNATTTGTTTINVQDNANANFSGTETYTLIQGGARFNGTLGGPNFTVTGSNRFVNYGLIRVANQDYVITRTNNAENVVTNDIANSPFGGAPGIGQNVTTFVNATNTAAYNNLLLAKNSADSANFVGTIVTDTSAAITNAQLDVAKDIQAQLGNRLGALRYLGTPEMVGSEAGAIPAAVAAGDEAVDNVAYGIWAKPFYTDAHQSKKGGLAGYKAKTTGIVIGLDTLANNNLMIGAAIGITKTDIKHQDYKKGDKTDVNGFSFSLYGAQQLVENFFAQGSAIFSLNQVKNKSQRYFFDANGNMSKQIAAGNYDNMTFGGNLTVGYDYNAMQGVLVTPMAGLSYLKSSDENYKETGTTVANKQVNSKFSDRTDLIVGAKVAGGTMNITDFAVYPEVHAFVVHKVTGRLSKTQSVLDGQVTPCISQPDRTAKTSYNLGLSASIRSDAKMEYGIGYDAQIASKYTAHQGTLKVRVNF
ncbi:outer membrane autotransporter barrel domain-containing protein [Rickettsia conorii subsp. heilongjiangensis]|uniref:Outer membrane protein B n=11 Tax=Rickettsia TaxID=780 RepID=A0AAD1GJI4_RICCR|nr:outer membrane protein OmpB [Rickettsia conorii]AEK75073.1 outer membrane protein B (cell surface antigen sca5) [Rickettsia conorii subsp. heilongjiangensis 054]BBM91805.1 outer membrane autotransporter barrel domain-containing protein [Rickettsia conorii subsp. heilongjiangensis]BBM93014.1 outer membrane autotransporter barrel domain-containing protein [Rickettsia conorii subsp. heilongjiangensis]BBM94223.1 outer membrane autotransporter barrel domain-containing protein [Rickettsia conorii 